MFMKANLHKFGGLCLAVILAATLASPFTASAQDKAKEKPAATKEVKEKDHAPQPYPFNGKVNAVDKDKKTITVMGKEKARTFYVDGQTKITKHEKPATLNDAVMGEHVAGRVHKTDDGREVLVSLHLGAKPESGEKPANKKAKTEEAPKAK